MGIVPFGPEAQGDGEPTGVGGTVGVQGILPVPASADGMNTDSVFALGSEHAEPGLSICGPSPWLAPGMEGEEGEPRRGGERVATR
jgi:hypothetical protein